MDGAQGYGVLQQLTSVFQSEVGDVTGLCRFQETLDDNLKRVLLTHLQLNEASVETLNEDGDGLQLGVTAAPLDSIEGNL